MDADLPLRDIHLPEPISWWPPALGWWLLVFGVPMLLFATAWLWRFLKRETIKKAALRELESIAVSDWGQREQVQQLNILLRRIALSLYPREEVAGLVGADWLEFLDRGLKVASGPSSRTLPRVTKKKGDGTDTANQGSGGEVDRGENGVGEFNPQNSSSRVSRDGTSREKPVGAFGFSKGAGRLLIEAPYRREPQADLEELFAVCRAWIKSLPKEGSRSLRLRSAKPSGNAGGLMATPGSPRKR